MTTRRLARPALATARRAVRPVPLLLLLAAPAPAAAQAAQTGLDEALRLVRDAVLFAERGDTAAALEQLRRATRLAPNMAEAHYRQGMLLARQASTAPGDMFTRRAASNALERALRIEQRNPRYLLELGRLRLKQGLGRLEAQRLFNRALDAARERGDPVVVADVEAELGDVNRRRYEAVANRRLITGAALRFDPDEAIGNPRYAREFLAQQSAPIPEAGELDLRQAEAHYRAGISAWPAHDASTAGLLGILYDGRRYEEFLELARAFVRAAPASARAHLFHGLGLWAVRRPTEAARAFARALDLMTPAERAPLGDLSVILRRSDAERYRDLTSAQRAEFERVYWSVNDPLRLTAENEHRLEHLARLAYSDIRFSAPDLRLRGWETDRGVIYVRYGPPPVVASFGQSTDGWDGESIGKIVTVWYYPERNLRFVFYGPPGYNFARFAGEFQAYAEDARYALPVKYDNVPVNEALDSVAVQAASFRPRGDSAGRGAAELVLFAGVPLRDLAAGVDLASGPLETGFFVTDPLERDVISRRGTETVQFQASHHFEIRTFTATLAPGQYRYRVEALQPATRRAARGAAGVTVSGFDRPTLLLSDVVVADRVVPRRERAADRSDFFIDPNAALRFAPGQPVHLYWEVYNLSVDSTETARFQVDVVVRVQALERFGLLARVVGGVADAVGTSARGDDQVTIRYTGDEALGGRDRLPGWLAVDLVGAPNGTFLLELTVTDLRSGQIATRQRAFVISDVGTAEPR